MIGGKNILKIAKHVAKRNRGSFDVELTHPAREWIVGVIVSVCLTFTLGALAWFTYYAQLEQIEKPVVADEPLIEYKQEKAREVLELFGERERTFEALRTHQSVTEKEVFVPDAGTEASLAGEEGTP